MMDYAKEYDRIVEQSNIQQEKIEAFRRRVAEKDAEIEMLKEVVKQRTFFLNDTAEQLATGQAREVKLRGRLVIQCCIAATSYAKQSHLNIAVAGNRKKPSPYRKTPPPSDPWSQKRNLSNLTSIINSSQKKPNGLLPRLAK